MNLEHDINEFKNANGSWSRQRFEKHRKELINRLENVGRGRPTTRLVGVLLELIDRHFDALDEPTMLCQDSTYVLSWLIEDAHESGRYRWD